MDQALDDPCRRIWSHEQNKWLEETFGDVDKCDMQMNAFEISHIM